MELKEYVKGTLERSKGGLTRVLNTLTQEELAWRPANGCNSMGLILFHIAKSEDSFVQSRLQDIPQVWESEKWWDKLGMKEEEAGSHYTIEEVNEFTTPDSDKLLAYLEAVRTKTLDYLESLGPEDFDKKVTMPFGDFTVAGILALTVSHSAQHAGEISYLRGMLRGMDK